MRQRRGSHESVLARLATHPEALSDPRRRWEMALPSLAAQGRWQEARDALDAQLGADARAMPWRALRRLLADPDVAPDALALMRNRDLWKHRDANAVRLAYLRKAHPEWASDLARIAVDVLPLPHGLGTLALTSEQREGVEQLIAWLDAVPGTCGDRERAERLVDVAQSLAAWEECELARGLVTRLQAYCAEVPWNVAWVQHRLAWDPVCAAETSPRWP